MKGKYRVRIQNRKLRYEFEITRNITVIKGNSATGKTTLVDMIREYYENGRDSGIELNCPVSCAVLEGKNWKSQLAQFQGSILFIDEGNRFVASQEFAEAIQGSDNYYVIVTRESLPMLPYSVEEIYGIRNSGKYGTLKRTYNEMYHIYSVNVLRQEMKPGKVITEDSNAGFEFFNHICREKGIACVAAGGKSNLFALLMTEAEENTLVVADGAAIGSEMEKLMDLLRVKSNVYLYLPESFEWLILSAGVLEDHEIPAILESPWEYIDGKEFFSWERYFSALLINRTQETYLEYSKSRLNPAYLKGNVEERIIKTMKDVKL